MTGFGAYSLLNLIEGVFDVIAEVVFFGKKADRLRDKWWLHPHTPVSAKKT